MIIEAKKICKGCTKSACKPTEECKIKEVKNEGTG